MDVDSLILDFHTARVKVEKKRFETILGAKDEGLRWVVIPRHRPPAPSALGARGRPRLLLASPCCQGHSKARGKASGNPQHDSSRSTAWAVVSALEYHRPPGAVVENVPEFVGWALYPAWLQAVQALGYWSHPRSSIARTWRATAPGASVLGADPQPPLMLELHQRQHVPAASFLDFTAGKWSPIEKPGRAAATLARVANGRAGFGDEFIMPYYGKGLGLTGRCTSRPIGTITTLDRWALVRGDVMWMLSASEALTAQSFPASTLRPDKHRLTMHIADNAVPPLAGQRILEAMMAAA